LISIVVVIDKAAAGAHRLREPFLPESTVVVSEMDPRLSRDVAELNLRVGDRRKANTD
jgi:hypothetical protein